MKNKKLILTIVLILLLLVPVVAASSILHQIASRFEEGSQWWATSTSEGTELPWYDRYGQAIDFVFFMFLFMAITHIALSKAVGKEWKDAGAKNAAVALAIILGAAMGIAAVKAGMSVTFFVPFVKNVLFFIVWFLVFLLLKVMLGDKHKIIMMLFALLITYLLFNVAGILLDKDRKFNLGNMIGIPTAEESCFQVEAKHKRKMQEFQGFKNSLRTQLKILYPGAKLDTDDALYQKLIEWETQKATAPPPTTAGASAKNAATKFINGLSKKPSKDWKEYEEDILKLEQRIVDCRKKGLLKGSGADQTSKDSKDQTLSTTGTPDTCYFWNPGTQYNLKNYRDAGAFPWSKMVEKMNQKNYELQDGVKCGDPQIRIRGLVKLANGNEQWGQVIFKRGKSAADPMTYYYSIDVNLQTKLRDLCKANTAKCWQAIVDNGYANTNLLSDGLFGPITLHALTKSKDADLGGGKKLTIDQIAVDQDPFVFALSVELNLISQLEGTSQSAIPVSSFNPVVQNKIKAAKNKLGQAFPTVTP